MSDETDKKPEDKKPEEKTEERSGIGEFFKNNMGLIAGGLLGGALMFMMGGSGILGLLIPLIGALVGSAFIDKGDGLLGIGEKKAPAGPEPKKDAGKDEPNKDAGKDEPAKTEEKSMPQAMVGYNPQVQVKDGDKVITGFDDKGKATFADPTGTPKESAEVSLLETAPATGDGKESELKYRYTGFVRGNEFVVTTVSAYNPASKDFDTPKTFDSTAGSEAMKFAIGADGKVNLGTTNAQLDAVRKELDERVANYNGATQLAVDVKDNVVKAELKPETRNGKQYVTTLIGTRDNTGIITFTKAQVAERTPEGDRVIVDPRSNDGVVALSKPLTAREIKDGDKTSVALQNGGVIRVSDSMTTTGVEYDQMRDVAMASSMTGEKTANLALNGLETKLKKQYQGQMKMGVLESSLASNAVASFYAEADNRGPKLDEEALTKQLQSLTLANMANGSVPRALSDEQIKSIVAETKRDHATIVKSLDGMELGLRPGEAGPQQPAAGLDIPRVSPDGTPIAGSTVVPPTGLPPIPKDLVPPGPAK